CGGAHRLVGLARAVQAKQRLGLADTPIWQRAQGTLEQALQNVREHRSSNGALSSYYFVRAGTTADLSAELASSGHLLEFLAVAAPAEMLAEPWVELAAARLCEVLESTHEVELDC